MSEQPVKQPDYDDPATPCRQCGGPRQPARKGCQVCDRCASANYAAYKGGFYFR